MKLTRWSRDCPLIIALLMIVLLPLFSTTPSLTGDKLYSIGEEGPAKGWVFYDKGEYSQGWRYLEVAPANTERALQWGSFQALAGSSSPSLGDGKGNTDLIVASMSTLAGQGSAAAYCTNLQINGFSDWFLPSKEELDLLYRQLALQHLGDFKGIKFGYWSSTEYDETRAWAQGFYAGVQGRIEKTELFLVRAIRAF